MTKRQFSLEPLSLPEVGALELVEIAADTGYDFVSLVLQSAHITLPADPVVHDEVLRKTVKRAMDNRGVGMLNIECFNLTPSADFREFAHALEIGRDLGARCGTAIIWENANRSEALSSYRRLCDMAKEMDISVNIEFFAAAQSMHSLEAAVDFVRDSGRTNTGVVLDLLHIMRCGNTVEDVAGLPSALAGSIQVCDGPATLDESDFLSEAGGNRMPPGNGDFPVKSFIEALPDNLVIGLEVPQIALIGQIAPIDRARHLIEAARSILPDGATI